MRLFGRMKPRAGKRKARASIPVGLDGFVPFEAIVRRFHEMGSWRDSERTHEVVLPVRLTPEQIAGWWDDPSSCDIEGVDTLGAAVYSVPPEVRGRSRRALARIAVIASPEEAARIKRVMAEAFTAQELELMAESPSLVISTQPHLDDCTGYYVRRQEGEPVPRIILEEGTTPDGIVHELVHHLRALDGRTAFPTKGRVLSPDYAKMSKARRGEVVTKEEAETVAETVARTKVDPVESGYYSHVPGMDPRAAYLRDQRIISGSRALKGKEAILAAQQNFERSSISRAIISANRKRGRRRCSGGARSWSASRRTPPGSPRRSATGTSTRGRPGCSTTAARAPSSSRSTRTARRGGGPRTCATARTRSSSTGRPRPTAT